MTTFARRERAALVSTLRTTGPQAPTLCAGWASRDLAAHIVVREHAPVGALGIWAAPLKDHTAKIQAELAAQDWEELLAQVAAPPAWWHPARLGGRVEALFDDAEMFIHHEDVRRGDGVARPRHLPADDEDALWRVLKGVGRLAYRGSPVGIAVEVPGRPVVQLHRADGGHVTIRGAVGEVLLASYGRARAAEVDLEGRPEDVSALESSALGL